MIPTLNVKGYRSVVTACALKGRALLLISLVNIMESVWATIAAAKNGHSVRLADGKTNFDSFAFQSTKVTQGRLKSGAFHAIAVGQRAMAGEVPLLPKSASLGQRFYSLMLEKSTLPLHASC